MKRIKVFFLVSILSLSLFKDLSSLETKTETQKIEQIIGLKGEWHEEESVFKISIPRTDVQVTVDGWKIPPFMGLTSWTSFSFMAAKKAILVMGDLVLFEDEVNLVMRVVLENGLQVTALHNHFFYDHPRVFFMHIEGSGKTEMLAKAVKNSLDKVKEIRKLYPSVSVTFGDSPLGETSSIAQKTIEDILQVKGNSQNGMVKVVLGRTTKMGQIIGKEMGVNSWAAFAGTDDNAVVDGDIAIFEDELQKVLKALTRADINVVAIHNHMIHDDPHVLFLHYWGRGSVKKLAKGVKSALDQTKQKL